jgi:V8-like Glu-specific endopeptidase
MSAEGYPLDKSLFRDENWYKHTCSVIGNYGPLWKHNCDTVQGDSGGPLFYYPNGYSLPVAIGIVTNQALIDGVYFNEARSFDVTVWTFVRDYSSAW